MKITIIGTGFVGLVSGVCFSDFGHIVTCVDTDSKKIDLLNKGGIPIYEPGLETVAAKNVKEERLFFTTELKQTVAESEVVFIAVGTPENKETGAADLSYVHAVAKEVAGYITGYTVIVNKSTVPVGTSDEVEAIIRKANTNADFDVVSNPEFLREGAAMSDFKYPDRIVIGAETERAGALMRSVYRPFDLNITPLVITNRRTSELIKYAGNAFLATKIGFINEMADLCDKVGADVMEVSRGIGLDSRISPKFLNAGPGYGGSCFPKDTMAISNTARHVGSPLRIIEAVVEANDIRKRNMAGKIIESVGGSVKGKTIAVLGLSFKPDTDDMRESPAIIIIQALEAAGANVKAYDPEAMDEAKHMLPDITYCSGVYDCAKNADALAIITEWDKFRVLDFGRLSEIMKSKTLIDFRNIYEPGSIRQLGYNYISVGRN